MNKTLLFIALNLCSFFTLNAQTAADTEILFELKDALWNQTSTIANDTGTPGGSNGTISGTDIKFVNNGGGGTALEYSITTSDAKIDGVTADWGDKFVLETRIKKSALEEGGTNSEIHILKNVVTTGVDWFINTEGKMVFKVGSSINVVSQNSVLIDDSWTTLGVAVDLTQATLADAVKFFVNGTASETGEESTPVLNEIVFDQTVNSDIATNPIDITGLDGDLYDYTIVINADNGGVSNSIYLSMNNDTSSNYRNYYMRSEGSGTLAYTTDSTSNFFLMDQPGYNEPGMAIVNISGNATSEKIISAMTSGATGSKKIYKMDGSWKNTTDKLTSIQVRGSGTGNFNVHVRAYRTPKDQTDDNWELVEKVNFSSRDLNANPIEFTGLDGDNDKKYKVNLNWDSGGTSGLLEFNDDTTGNNYSRLLLYNNNGSLSSVSSTAPTFTYQNSSAIINSVSGSKRLVTVSNSSFIDNVKNSSSAHWWNNTVDNITKLTFRNAVSGSFNGSISLFKQKDPAGVADRFNLPFQKIAEHDINGNFSAGHVFDNLTGDSKFLYKIEYVGSGSSQLRVQPNSDSGSNYTSQRLVGIEGSVVGAVNSPQYFYLCEDGATTNSAELYIYPKSGQERTVLSTYAAQENRIDLRSQWWNNTTDEITSLKVYASDSTSLSGKLILSAIPLDTTGYMAQQEEESEYPEGSSFKVYDETFSGRNFNTNPLTIPNLEGDTYDYKGFVILNNGGDNLFLYNRLNGDTGNNYRNYYMRGGGSTSSASVNDNSSGIQTGFSNSAPSLMMFEITGSTGSERAVNYFSANESTAGRYVYNVSNFWKNTTDEITNLDFYYTSSATVDARIILYAIPKTGNKGNWELVESINFNSRDIGSGANPISFIGLDGDTDEEYKLVFEGECAGNSYFGLWLNNDSGSNYDIQELHNYSIGSQSRNDYSYLFAGQGESGNLNRAEFQIFSKSGKQRLVNISANKIGQEFKQIESAGWWNNTTDNLTSIQIRANAGTSQVWSGNAKLYKRKDPAVTGGDLHWETVESVPVNGDFSGGYTFSGLSGNSETLYKVEYLGSGNGGNQFIQFNGDSGDNYSTQFFESTGSSTTAQVLRLSKGWITDTGADTNYYKVLVYPKSGNNRTLLTEGAKGTSSSSRRAIWWENSTDEITSIKVFANSTGSMNGILILSKLVDPQPIGETNSGQVALDETSTYSENVYPTISGQLAIEMLTKTGDFSLQTDYIKMTLKRSTGDLSSFSYKTAEGYKVDENYNSLVANTPNLLIYPPNLLRRVHNPSTDFTQGQPNGGVTVDLDTGVQNKVFYGMFQFEFALNNTLAETSIIDVYIKTTDFDFKKIAEITPTPKPVDPNTPWVIKYYWNSRQAQFDWDGNAYKSTGPIQMKLDVR